MYTPVQKSMLVIAMTAGNVVLQLFVKFELKTVIWTSKRLFFDQFYATLVNNKSLKYRFLSKTYFCDSSVAEV